MEKPETTLEEAIDRILDEDSTAHDFRYEDGILHYKADHYTLGNGYSGDREISELID